MRRRLDSTPGWLRIPAYGAALAAGTLVLQWLDYQRLARTHLGDIAVVLIAAGFLALGVFIGARVMTARAPVAAPEGNRAAQASLGISARELAVLQQLAAGRSNKEAAAALGISPNTVKTHVARLFEKLGASRRTAAIARARELGLVA